MWVYVRVSVCKACLMRYIESTSEHDQPQCPKRDCPVKLRTADPLRNEAKSALTLQCVHDPALLLCVCVPLTVIASVAFALGCRFDRALQNLVDKLLPQFLQREDVSRVCTLRYRERRARPSADALALRCTLSSQALKRELLEGAGLKRSTSDAPGWKKRTDVSAHPVRSTPRTTPPCSQPHSRPPSPSPSLLCAQAHRDHAV